MTNSLRAAAWAAVCLAAATGRSENVPGFTFRHRPGDQVEVLYQGDPVASYQYALDTSTKERRHDTYKPFLHILDPKTGAPITKGPGGRFTHHRGVFVGWNRIQLNGRRHDLWHMKNALQKHLSFAALEATEDEARIEAKIDWALDDGAALIHETRAMRFRPSAVGFVAVRLTTELWAAQPGVVLSGDPEHAGVQYRPANEIKSQETVYAFPRADADPKKDRDYRWVGQTHAIGEEVYSVIHMNHPSNPKGVRHSAYRDYGRFGAFLESPLSTDQPLRLTFQFLIARGPLPARDRIENEWRQFADEPVSTGLP